MYFTLYSLTLKFCIECCNYSNIKFLSFASASRLFLKLFLEWPTISIEKSTNYDAPLLCLILCSPEFIFFLRLARMTGHQQLVNDVKFSPDSRLIASASFDKSIKIWDGKTGAYITTLRGHVQAVYQISWSSDSRLLVSGSADSTVKGKLS